MTLLLVSMTSMRLLEADTFHDVGSTRVHSALSGEVGEAKIVSEAEMTRPPERLYAGDYREREEWCHNDVFVAAATGREHPWLYGLLLLPSRVYVVVVGSQAVQNSDLWLWLAAPSITLRGGSKITEKWFKSNRNHNWKNRFKSDQNSFLECDLNQNRITY